MALGCHAHSAASAPSPCSPARIRARAVRVALAIGALELLAIGNLVWMVHRAGMVTAGRYLRADSLTSFFLINIGLIFGLVLTYSVGYLRHIPAGPVLVAALVLRPGVPVSVHHGVGVPVGEPGHAVDFRRGDDAGFGAAGGLLQHRGRGRSRLEVPDRLHGGNCLRAVRHDHAVPGGRAQRPGSRQRAGLGDTDERCSVAERRARSDEAGIRLCGRRLRHQGRVRPHAQLAARRARRGAFADQRVALRRAAELRHVRAAALRRHHRACDRHRLQPHAAADLRQRSRSWSPPC